MQYAHEQKKMSLRQACKMMSISPGVYYYKPKVSDDHLIREQLSELAAIHNRWGFWMMHGYLRGLHYLWNHKRVYRIYTEMGLNLLRKHKKRLPARVLEPLEQPSDPNMTWSMDFVHDALSNGVKYRSFNIIDDFNREALNITMDTSLTAKRVIRELEGLIAWRGAPARIRVDNGPEFIAEAMAQWAKDKKVDLKFIQKGKPYQNGYLSFCARYYQ